MYRVPIGKKFSELNDEEKTKFLDYAKSNFEKIAANETESIKDFQKHLWLVNSTAATISIGIMQANGVKNSYQFWGAAAFIFGVITLLVFKSNSEIITSRERSRYQKILDYILSDAVAIQEKFKLRDRVFNYFRYTLIVIRVLSVFSFVVGLLLHLYAFKDYAFISQ